MLAAALLNDENKSYFRSSSATPEMVTQRESMAPRVQWRSKCNCSIEPRITPNSRIDLIRIREHPRHPRSLPHAHAAREHGTQLFSEQFLYLKFELQQSTSATVSRRCAGVWICPGNRRRRRRSSSGRVNSRGLHRREVRACRIAVVARANSSAAQRRITVGERTGARETEQFAVSARRDSAACLLLRRWNVSSIDLQKQLVSMRKDRSTSIEIRNKFEC